MNRREFIRHAGAAIGSAATLGLHGCGTAGQHPTRQADSRRPVWLIHDPGDPIAASPPARWAAEELRSALIARSIPVREANRLEGAASVDLHILASGPDAPLTRQLLSAAGLRLPEKPESLALIPIRHAGRQMLLACGRDARGLAYALTDLADRVACADEPEQSLVSGQPLVEQPANSIRGIMRLFASDIEDRGWFNDRNFWRPYLTMLATQRFNRFNLALGLGYDFARNIRDAYFYFAYPFLTAVPGYDVRVTNLTDAERASNLQMLRFISDEAVARGLHFQLGIWSHVNEWADSPEANHTITGLRRQNHAAYCRDALRAILIACPAIGGVTFRIHGESGIPEGSYDFWKVVFDGVARCGRQVNIDLHAKGIDQRMIDIALATKMPVTVAPKFWAEHMGLSYHQAAIRPTEMPPAGVKDEGFFSKSSGSRRFMRYGYGDLMREDRRFGILHRMWPGTQRLLLWGDPALAAGYGRSSSFCGSLGLELFEPLSFKGRQGSGVPGGRNAYADPSLRPAADWKKYEYGYRLWGRLLYNPESDPQTWRRFLRAQYGEAAAAAEGALAHASRILPLVTTAHCPSAANFNYWPEMYTNMPIVDRSRPHPYGDTPTPKIFGAVSPLDPQLFYTIHDFVDALLRDDVSGKYSPVEVARWLDELAEAASRHLADVQAMTTDRSKPVFQRMIHDAGTQIGLGRFFAAKLRAGVLYALHERSGDSAALREAIKAYRAARQAWVELADWALGVYVSDITFGPPAHLRGHWADRLGAIDVDLADMGRRSRKEDSVSTRPGGSPVLTAQIRDVLAPRPRPQPAAEHIPPLSFTAGRPLPIELNVAMREVTSVWICYRHVNQAESFRSAPLQQHESGRYRGEIPGEYAAGAYPLQYYFELRSGPRRKWLYPGLNATLSNQPYFVVRRQG